MLTTLVGTHSGNPEHSRRLISLRLHDSRIETPVVTQVASGATEATEAGCLLQSFTISELEHTGSVEFLKM